MTPALLDRGGELVELGVVEALARIAGIGLQKLDRRLAGAPRARRVAVVLARPEQRCETASKARPVFRSAKVFGHGVCSR